jgi:hypothetical protein
MPYSSFLTNIPEERMMQKVLQMNEFFILCERRKPQSQQGASKTTSFSLRVRPCNTIGLHSPMS